MRPASASGGEYRFRCGQRITIANADRVRLLLREAYHKAPRLIIDLRDLRECDSSGLKLFIDLHRMAEKEHHQVLLYNPRPAILDLLRMTRLDTVLVIGEDNNEQETL
jgi:anti-anti-sigma factor